jgi:hypothetical protein
MPLRGSNCPENASKTKRHGNGVRLRKGKRKNVVYLVVQAKNQKTKLELYKAVLS